MTRFVLNMLANYREIWRRRDLIHHLVSGQRRAALHGTRLGILWHLLAPMSQIAIYYFLLVVIFRSNNPRGLTFLQIAMGVMHYTILTQTGGYVLPSIYSNSSLLLQVKINPMVLMAAGFMRVLRGAAYGIVLFWIVYLAIDGVPSTRALLYPVILLLWITWCWAVGLCIASVAVYLRDLARLYPIVVQVLMYGSPVIYSYDRFPEAYRHLLLLNPVASIFSLFQWALFNKDVDVTYAGTVALLWITAALFVAHAVYHRLQPKFTKVL